jgi:MFS family permease
VVLQDATTTRSAGSPATADRGRRAVTAVFFLNGLLLSSYIVRLPSLKADHRLSDGQLGALGTLFGAAALIAMQFVGAFTARVGSARVIRLALIAMPLAVIAIGTSRSTIAFGLAITLTGAVHGMLDVAMNAHAVAVERIRQRPIMSGCHAAWSVSAVLASLIGALVIHAGISPATHFVAIGIVVFAAGLAVSPLLMPPSVDRLAPQRGSDACRAGWRSGWRSGWTRAIVALGGIGVILMICDGAALAWSGIFLHDNRGATLTVASMAVTAYTASQTSGRLAGDWLKQRFGGSALFRAGGLLAVTGLALAVFSPRLTLAIAGFAVFGLGASNLIPLTFSAAGRAGGDGTAAATALARFTTFTYAGILFGPAAIGWVAQGIGLMWTLAVLIPILGAVAVSNRVAAAAA